MITVRRMQAEDAKRASELEKDNFSQPWSEQAFAETLEQNYALYCVAEEDEKVIGICGLRNILGEGEITNVAVEESARRNGAASKMLKYLLKEGVRNGITAFTLEVRTSNLAAINLYEKYGFKTEGRRKDFYEKPREDAFIMWKR